MQPTAFGRRFVDSLDLAPPSPTHQEREFIKRFCQNQDPRVATFKANRVEFRVFNFTPLSISIEGCQMVKIRSIPVQRNNPGFDHSPYGNGSNELENFELHLYDKTNIAIFEQAGDLILCHQIASDPAAPLKMQKLTYSTQYNCWLAV